jgi:Tfp pilus assembly protein PilO
MTKLLARKELMLVSTIAVGLALYAFAYVLPQGRHMGLLRERITARRTELTRELSQSSQVPAIRLEVEQLRQYTQDLKQAMPDSAGAQKFLAELSQIVQRDGLALLQMKPGRTTQATLADSTQVAIRLNGEFLQLVHLLASLERMPQSLQITDLVVTPSREVAPTIDVQLSVAMLSRPTRAGTSGPRE